MISFHNAYTYQITMYTLNILQFYTSIKVKFKTERQRVEAPSEHFPTQRASLKFRIQFKSGTNFLWVDAG